MDERSSTQTFKINTMQKYEIFVGIDMSKRWFNAALYCPGLEGKLPQGQFDNNPAGFQKLVNWLVHQTATRKPESQWYVCMEHTGIYGLALAHFLDKRQIKIVMECPLRIARSLGLRRSKTDSADAVAIAHYAFKEHEHIKVRPLPSEGLLQIHSLLSLRARLTRYAQGLNVAAKELKGFVPASVSDAVLQGTQPVSQQIGAQIKVIDKQLKQLIEEDVQLNALYTLLKSIKGIGLIIGAYLLVYTNGFTAFEKSRQFACYIGIAPFPYQSGSSIRRPDQVSYLANKRLKALISTAATVATCHDPEFKIFFDRQTARRKDEGWIYNAIKNKIIHRVFAVVKRGTPYVVRGKHVALT